MHPNPQIILLPFLKRETPELGLAEPVVSINAFIEEELERLEAVNPQRRERREPLLKLNALFHATLSERT
jgi:hypothetical protein